MQEQFAVAGLMQECTEKTELYMSGKDMCFITLEEPMTNVQQWNHMHLVRPEIAQELQGEEPPQGGAYVAWYWMDVVKRDVLYRQEFKLH